MDFLWLLLDWLSDIVWWMAAFVLVVIILFGVLVVSLIGLYALALRGMGKE